MNSTLGAFSEFGNASSFKADGDALRCREVFSVFGNTGLGRVSDAAPFLFRNLIFRDDASGAFSVRLAVSAAQRLKEWGLLKKEAEYGLRETLEAFELTEMGAFVYQMMSGEKPAEPEVRKLLREHGSLSDAYLMKDLSLVMAKMGFRAPKTESDSRAFDFASADRAEFVYAIKNKEDCDKLRERLFAVAGEAKHIRIAGTNEQKLLARAKRLCLSWAEERFGSKENARGFLVSAIEFSEILNGERTWDTTRV